MRAMLPALSFPLILLATACGRHAPPSAGPSAPVARPAGGGGASSSPAPAASGPVAPARASAVKVQTVSLVPTETQRAQMTGVLKQTLAGLHASQRQGARDVKEENTKRQARYAATLADYHAKQAAQAAAAKVRLAAARAEWERRAADCKAMLANPKASATDKENARAVLAAGFVPPAEGQDTMPPPTPQNMPQVAVTTGGDAKATADCDQWIYRFRQAVEAHDHAKALAAMRAIGELAPRVSPALLASYMGEANRYLAGPAALAPADAVPFGGRGVGPAGSSEGPRSGPAFAIPGP